MTQVFNRDHRYLGSPQLSNGAIRYQLALGLANYPKILIWDSVSSSSYVTLGTPQLAVSGTALLPTDFQMEAVSPDFSQWSEIWTGSGVGPAKVQWRMTRGSRLLEMTVTPLAAQAVTVKLGSLAGSSFTKTTSGGCSIYVDTNSADKAIPGFVLLSKAPNTPGYSGGIIDSGASFTSAQRLYIVGGLNDGTAAATLAARFANYALGRIRTRLNVTPY